MSARSFQRYTTRRQYCRCCGDNHVFQAPAARYQISPTGSSTDNVHTVQSSVIRWACKAAWSYGHKKLCFLSLFFQVLDEKFSDANCTVEPLIHEFISCWSETRYCIRHDRTWDHVLLSHLVMVLTTVQLESRIRLINGQNCGNSPAVYPSDVFRHAVVNTSSSLSNDSQYGLQSLAPPCNNARERWPGATFLQYKGRLVGLNWFRAWKCKETVSRSIRYHVLPGCRSFEHITSFTLLLP